VIVAVLLSLAATPVARAAFFPDQDPEHVHLGGTAVPPGADERWPPVRNVGSVPPASPQPEPSVPPAAVAEPSVPVSASSPPLPGSSSPESFAGESEIVPKQPRSGSRGSRRPRSAIRTPPRDATPTGAPASTAAAASPNVAPSARSGPTLGVLVAIITLLGAAAILVLRLRPGLFVKPETPASA
jgi:hypothetical protein